MKQSAYMLLVDDDEDLRDTLQETLEMAKHHVTTAANAMRAKDAMENARSLVKKYDVEIHSSLKEALRILRKVKYS